MQSALEEARLLALQSRLNPHFLFNALNLVAELCREEPEEAERCVLRLAGLLRAALDATREPGAAVIPLGRELDLCADYLDLCRARFGERLQVEIERTPDAEQRAGTLLRDPDPLRERGPARCRAVAPSGGLVRVRVLAGGPAVRVQVYEPGALPAASARAGSGSS